MKHSPLQLLRYVVTDIACTANPQFNPEQEIQGALEEYSISAKANPLEPTKDVPGHSWSVELSVTQKKKEGQNLPYEFRLSMVGIFSCKDGVLDSERETRFVQVNGSSMLYGMAREHIRALTAAGPWGAIIIPTMSFYEKKEQLHKEDASAKSEPGQ
jgi:preprotein translocase subunit SecB